MQEYEVNDDLDLPHAWWITRPKKHCDCALGRTAGLGPRRLSAPAGDLLEHPYGV